MLVSQDVTLNPAIYVETGATGIVAFAQNNDRISTVFGGDLTNVISFEYGGLIVTKNIQAQSFDATDTTTQYPYQASRANSAVGAEFTRSGTGASTARFMASGGGAVMSDGTNSITITNTKINIAHLPTSSSGLSSGDVWSNSGVLTIV
jgi:hypothetical protein